MTILIIITYDLSFSNNIIEYFKFQNSCNSYKFSFIPIGLNMGTENEILDSIKEKLSSQKNLENVVIISDAGLPTKLAKRIKFDNDGVKLFRSKGSLIENGFLTYIMLNSKAPIETIDSIMNDKIEK